MPGDFATVEADGSVTLLGRGFDLHQLRAARRSSPRRSSPRSARTPTSSTPSWSARPTSAGASGWPPSSQPRTGRRPRRSRPSRTTAGTHVAGYKVPRQLHVVETIVRSPSGKPDYRWAADIVAEAPDETDRGARTGRPIRAQLTRTCRSTCARCCRRRACAVLTMEIQRGVVGDLTSFPELAAEADRGRVVAEHSPAARGGPAARASRSSTARRIPRRPCRLHRELPAHAGRCSAGPSTCSPARRRSNSSRPRARPGRSRVCARLHGVSPFTGTSLDTLLRNLGSRRWWRPGISVNLGVLGLAIEAVNLGYQVVVPRDAVAGHPDRLRRTAL